MAAAAARRLLVLTRRGSLSPAPSTAASRSRRDPRSLCTLSTTLRSGAGEDEIERIRREFEDAKRNYLSIPAAIKDMPKMNPQGIYVNKNVKLDDLHVYGFDYDYTLSHYSEHLQCLIYDLAKKHLVNELKYPESCLKYEYDRSFPIRGLYYDRLKGCLLKLDFFGSIEPDGCFFGRRKLSLSEIKELYGTRHIGRDQALQLVGLMDVFCFSEACLLADIVQHFIDAKLEFDASYVYEDVNRSIQHVHRSGLIHRQILSEPQKFLIKKSQVFRFLKMLREKGKKLFLLTNSPFHFVDGGMRYLLEDQHFDGNSWRELFDVVIAQANKPAFYNSDHPFRVYDTQKDTLAFTAVDKFLPDQVYYHGCLKSFLQITKWRGPEVIYFGDHLLSDLRGPSKAGWRTAAVIRELEDEIEIQNSDSYRFQQAKLSIIHDLLGKVHATVVSTEKGQVYRALLDELNAERRQCRSGMRDLFNSSFGATFLTDTGRESSFAYHIHQYADIYTSKLENFLSYAPESWLHPPHDIKIMPHNAKYPLWFLCETT
ncbi:5'-nucleotidase domain-containing protein DDB_G0275467-like isoform X2 [Panicum virgatum]|uniref:5'-nucleotidase domain-containing protein DDB_G0275467-like isoform X2 n=1 Tax=Panicum virgatum TaxID=38727 RepID=UPI0019D627FE|nr:5'-nucleotidase domain-containing protein DDB_G0275467-like isoform X2 [Panicum virgatum]